MSILQTARPLLFLLVALSPALAACGGEDTGEGPEGEILPGDPRFERDPALDVENVSAHGDRRSHNMGQNCMGCHQTHGPGKGLFTAAGTVYGSDDAPAAGGSIELRTGPQGGGDLVLAIEVDDNGNFFTTEPLPLPDQSLFPFVRAPGGGAAFMPFPTISGACNVCHVGSQRVRVQ
jgi:hypothetical protein